LSDRKDDDSIYASDAGVGMLNNSVKNKVRNLRRRLNPWYAYIDTCSTFHQNLNEESVSHTREVQHILKSHSNGGISHTNLKVANYGIFIGNLETWFQGNGLGNIISFNELESLYPITYYHVNKFYRTHEGGVPGWDTLYTK